MDPKLYPKLDPKLKETYDRIMGTATSGKPLHHAAQTASPRTHAAPAANLDDAVTHQTQTTPHHLSHIAYTASSGGLKTHEKKPEHGESKKSNSKDDALIVPIIIGISGVIFFVAYAFFWVNFFGI
jgi:hypothetical protein